MTISLGGGRHIAVDEHSGKVWLTSYNGQGVVNPMTADQAVEVGLAIYLAGRKAMRKPHPMREEGSTGSD